MWIVIINILRRNKFIKKIFELYCTDDNFPDSLKNVKPKVKKIYAYGNLDLLYKKSIAVIGSRNSSEYGRSIAKKITKELIEKDIVIISGMAVGIDSVAHKACIENGGKTIAVLGLTFKPGTDDLREAPSIDNIELLLDEGANVRAYDPISIESFKKKIASKITSDTINGEIEYFDSIDEAITGADATLIMTEWPDVLNYDINNYLKLMKEPLVLDGRNCYNLKEIEKANIEYVSVGRRTILRKK